MNKVKVIKTAIKMCERAYAPFSNYKVGSAAKVKSGEIVGGCNVESCSYGLTCCAEGYNQFKSIAIATKNAGMPAGHADRSYGSFVAIYQYTYVI